MPAAGVLRFVEAMAKLGVLVNSPSNSWFDTRSQKIPNPPRTDILPVLVGSQAKPSRGLNTFWVWLRRCACAFITPPAIRVFQSPLDGNVILEIPSGPSPSEGLK